MIYVKPIERERIDQWPIPAAGLSERAVNGLGARHIQTVGELRSRTDEELLGYRNLGPITIRSIHDFFSLCARIERGELAFAHLHEVLDLFLSDEERLVLSNRYGLEAAAHQIGRKWMSLQSIGNELHITRERVRQIEVLARQKLSSHVARVCLQPFIEIFLMALDALQKTADSEELRPLGHKAYLQGYNPAACLLLVNHLFPEAVTHYHGVFSRYDAHVLEQIEQLAVAIVEQGDHTQTLAEITAQMPGGVEYETARKKKAIKCLLAHHPHIAATLDDRFCNYRAAFPSLIVEVMRTMNGAVHYRVIADAVNGMLHEASRKGAGFYLQALNADSRFARGRSGLYSLERPSEA